MFSWNLSWFIALSLSFIKCDFNSERIKLTSLDSSSEIGASTVLDTKEKIANKIFIEYKYDELEEAYKDPEKFYAGQHFFNAKENIETSKIFKIIKLVPKGASLHTHFQTFGSSDILFNLTFTFSAYLHCCVVHERLRMKFFKKINDTSCNWKPITTIRREDKNFNNFLKSQITLIREKHWEVYPNSNKIWKEFDNILITLKGFITYKPVFEKYIYMALQENYHDNVMYMEVRGKLSNIYDLDEKYASTKTCQFFLDTVELFKRDHPEFIGVKVIYALSRVNNKEELENHIEKLLVLQKKFPKLFIGFDIVGQEDVGASLHDFSPVLLRFAGKTKYFFHAGETNWNGRSTDLNLIDAILLNTTRIGHGYAMIKHPELLKIVKERQIPIELNPISNQVLMLLYDLRNHPANYLIMNGYPVVICSDDPGVWGAVGLSHDWYVAFMAMASRQADLRMLKQLAKNSIVYSAMDQEEKEHALIQWEQRWKVFIDELISFKKNARVDPKQ